MREYGVTLVPATQLKTAVAVVAAVSHADYRRMGAADLVRLMGANPVLVDVKGAYSSEQMKSAGIRIWTL